MIPPAELEEKEEKGNKGISLHFSLSEKGGGGYGLPYSLHPLEKGRRW